MYILKSGQNGKVSDSYLVKSSNTVNEHKFDNSIFVEEYPTGISIESYLSVKLKDSGKILSESEVVNFLSFEEAQELANFLDSVLKSRK